MRLHVGDCLDVLPGIADASVDAVVTDPPYSLSFMGREWDKFKPSEFQAWCEQWAAECLRVLKPGRVPEPSVAASIGPLVMTAHSVILPPQPQLGGTPWQPRRPRRTPGDRPEPPRAVDWRSL